MIKHDNLDKDMLRSVLDALPAMVFVVDNDVRIEDYNAAACEFLTDHKSAIIKKRGGEVLHCIHASDVLEGCGRGPFCGDCVIRNSVSEAFQGNRVVRRRITLEVIQDRNKIEIYALITTSPFFYKEKGFALLVIEDISEIAELRRMIPICSVCKKVRDEKDSWSRVETYFKEHWDIDFSHSLCPECYKIEIDKLNSTDNMDMTQISYHKAVTTEMEKIRRDHQIYPVRFKSDCNACWLRQLNPLMAAAELVVNYGWLDRPVKIRQRE
jgi:hypothetical protein